MCVIPMHMPCVLRMLVCESDETRTMKSMFILVVIVPLALLWRRSNVHSLTHSHMHHTHYTCLLYALAVAELCV